MEVLTHIKICGITNTDDALAAAAYGADALGFIGVASSPRYIAASGYDEISRALPIFVKRVIVVNKPEDADDYNADYIQHYADTADISRFRRGAQWRIRAFRIRDAASLEELVNYPEPVGGVLLDTYDDSKLGGSGETFDWALAQEAKRFTDKPIILAGGLTPENVQGALEAVRPYAVDVSSGIESSPGVKDHAEVKAFIRAVREWDLRQ